MDATPQLTLRERRALRAAIVTAIHDLDAQIVSLRRSFDDIVAANEHANTDDEHDPEGTTIAFERSQVSALLRQTEDDRAALRATLERVEGDPSYGVCEVCRGFIGVERLLALPAASKCIACAR
ncbi:MAG: TraR/DksA family transcriptional regulator [Ilumatobacteraceae bacterium]